VVDILSTVDGTVVYGLFYVYVSHKRATVCSELSADLSHAGRFLLRATVEVVALGPIRLDPGAAPAAAPTRDVAVGGVTLLDADVLWSSDTTTHDRAFEHGSFLITGGCACNNLEVSGGGTLLVGGRTCIEAPASTPRLIVLEPAKVDIFALAVDWGLRPLLGAGGVAALDLAGLAATTGPGKCLHQLFYRTTNIRQRTF